MKGAAPRNSGSNPGSQSSAYSLCEPRAFMTMIEPLHSARPPRAPTGASLDCETRVISDPSHLDSLEQEWRALFDVAPNASPALRWEWSREWWSVYGPVYGRGGRGLRIIAVRRGPVLIGVLPLYMKTPSGRWGSRELRFISSGEAEFEETSAEYLDLLHAPGAAAECVAAIGRYLSQKERLPWDQLVLSAMPASSPLLGLPERVNARAGRTGGTGPAVCYISDLSGGFETYLKRISSGARGEARKLLRQVTRAGMTFEIARTAEEALRYFDELVELHTSRWASVGKAGCFGPRHRAFHRALIATLVPTRNAVLSRLSFEGRTYAVTYGHLAGRNYYCYQRGVRIDTRPVRSPGTATLLLLMDHLASDGTLSYDHLAGANSFKQRFATGERPLAGMRLARPTIRYVAGATSDLLRRAAVKAAWLVRRSWAGEQALLPVSLASPVGGTD
jgi:CelD/BcsL family acetyltransferase involved in cellulose biosynthesis